jgi:hypothetical protein
MDRIEQRARVKILIYSKHERIVKVDGALDVCSVEGSEGSSRRSNYSNKG